MINKTSAISNVVLSFLKDRIQKSTGIPSMSKSRIWILFVSFERIPDDA